MEHVLLVILLLVTQTVDKIWHIIYNVKICIKIREIKFITIFPGEFL